MLHARYSDVARGRSVWNRIQDDPPAGIQRLSCSRHDGGAPGRSRLLEHAGLDEDGELTLLELGRPVGIADSGLGQQLQQEGDVEECQSGAQRAGLLARSNSSTVPLIICSVRAA